jgi:hypothetical protein
MKPVPTPLLSSSYAAATALEMLVWNTVVIPTLVLIHITIINCERETMQKATSEVYLLCTPSPQVNQVMSKADKWTDRRTCECMAV